MPTVDDLRRKYFKDEDHPYYTYENLINSALKPDSVLLDAGCGRGAPVLRKYTGKARKLIGVDFEEFIAPISGIELVRGDIGKMDSVDSGSVDMVISRAVLEHVQSPEAVLKEINRVLKPNGHFIFLVPNLYDYSSIISFVVPNKYHPGIVSKVEGRKVDDVFPTYYRINTKKAVYDTAKAAGFEISTFEYLGQYPHNLMFNKYLFLLGTCYEKLLEKVELLAFLRGWILVHMIKQNNNA